MDTKALRQKVLDLAIHGKLVPQDPNDEPASVLLERIKEEKERLVKEKKIKKGKPSEPIEEVPFEVPMGWELVRMQDLCSKFSTGPFGSMVHKTDYVEKDGTPLINPANIINGKITLDKMMYVSKTKGEELVRYILEENDILLARRGDLRKCAIIGQKENGWLCGTGSFFLRLVFVDTFFFKLIYNSNYVQSILCSESVGATMDNLNQGLLGNIIIPLPPLAEQKRIVAEVEKWMSAIDVLESSEADLKQSIAQAKAKVLDLAIKGKLVEKQGEWEEKRLGDVANYINGRAFKPEEWELEGKPIIRIQNLNDENAQYNYSSQEYESKYIVTKGDLLFAWAASLGTYIWEREDAWLNQHIFKVEPFEFITKRYLHTVLDAMIAYFYTQSHGSGMVHITRKAFEDIKIQVPPLSEQRRIVEKVEQIFAQLDKIQEAI